MKIYIVFEDYFELHEANFEKVFHGTFLTEEGAKKKVALMGNSPSSYSFYYYEEVDAE